MNSSSIKDPHLLLFSQKMGEYSEASLPKIGPRRREIIAIMEMQMKMPGYFLFITLNNSKLNRNSVLFVIITHT